MTKKKMVIIFSLIIFTAIQINLTGTTKPTLIRFGSDKILVIGHSQFLGYLNAYLNVSKGGTPLTKQDIYLDRLKLRDIAGGNYSNGTPYRYDIEAEKKITISLVPKTLLYQPGKRPKPIILGTYKVNNHIEWVYPSPDSKISISPTLLRTLKFRWNYTGKILRTKVRIKNFTTNTEVFNRTVTAEEISVPAHIFVRRNRYRFDLEVDGPVGLFKLTKVTAPGSKIEFFYWDHIYFDVK